MSGIEEAPKSWAIDPRLLLHICSCSRCTAQRRQPQFPFRHGMLLDKMPLFFGVDALVSELAIRIYRYAA